MNERKKRVKIITNVGYKYHGDVCSQDNLFIEIIDVYNGKIKIPLANISFIKEVDE